MKVSKNKLIILAIHLNAEFYIELIIFISKRDHNHQVPTGTLQYLFTAYWSEGYIINGVT